jgi:hypothetical protein
MQLEGTLAVLLYSGLKIEALCSSETVISTYKSTRRYSREDRHRPLHRREDL